VAHDFDWIVIGSGFGGSVAALRLAEKGYSVGVVECGRRYEDDDYAKSTWNWRRFLWSPRLGLKGIMRLTLFKDVFVLSGSGVGGGSLVYANTLYRPPARFFESDQWAGMADWHEALEPHYDMAERMLGAAEIPFDDPADDVLKEFAKSIGVEDTYGKPTVGVWFGEAGETVADPYFGGEGPDRQGCVRCGACMVGCRYNAKNTLVKNYMWLAERRGVEVLDERMATGIRPLGDSADGSEGYAVDTGPPGAWLPLRKRQTHTARGVIVAAGALGTNALLRRCKDKDQLPRLSERLGYLVRTNSEAILAVTARDKKTDFSERVAITGSIYPDEDTHIESVTYGRKGNSMRLLFAFLVEEGSRITRPLRLLKNMARRPGNLLTMLAPGSWARRTVILLVMQTLDNSMRFKPRRISLLGRRFTTQQDPDKPNPTFIPVANEAAEQIAEQIDGVPQSSIIESVAGIPVTAHILGGAAIGEDAEHGVVDGRHRVFGYENLLVCDGAAVPANPGVNPSLTITALAEHAMSHIPDKPGAATRPVRLPRAKDEEADTPAPGTAQAV
jgi:cholesterol oxidase